MYSVPELKWNSFPSSVELLPTAEFKNGTDMIWGFLRGIFLSKLATDMIFNGVTLMIAEGVFGKMNVLDSYPPTLFVHMPKDRIRMRLISENVKALRQKGIHITKIKCSEFPLTPNLLCRVQGLSQSVSQGLLELFHEKGFIDQNAYMRNDGRATHWKEALKERKLFYQRQMN
ncbi:hypothetical protein GIB67_028527 [Kingdonia uniflora]|uniref:Uncharacterized protein n=1 Tax=Kingdonia uniflora TaxID=39325 RepID=A0A7J7KVW3_9MAGN|nr:hypothetical protein GIB67_028527 [Kingdonia uniflora]